VQWMWSLRRMGTGGILADEMVLYMGTHIYV
jgi:SNF2 family DNA or RNA helicase